jgi:hypothetical protein
VRLLDDDIWGGGTPASAVRAIVVSDAESPQIEAEFAARIMLTRQGRRLRERHRGDPRPRRGSLANLWWIGWGHVERAADGALVIGSLGIAPHHRDDSPRSDVALGVTAEVLRAISPARILADAIAHIQTSGRWLEDIEQLGGPSMPEAQRQAIERIKSGRIRHSPVSEDEIEAIALRYLSLYRSGIKRPLRQIASEFGITRDQARDRVRRARELEFLTTGTPGRAGAGPGRRLRPNPPQTERRR